MTTAELEAWRRSEETAFRAMLATEEKEAAAAARRRVPSGRCAEHLPRWPTECKQCLALSAA